MADSWWTTFPTVLNTINEQYKARRRELLPCDACMWRVGGWRARMARQRPQYLVETWAMSARKPIYQNLPGTGDAGTYVPKSVLDAGEAEGVSLEYYKSYDTRACEGLGVGDGFRNVLFAG